MDLDLDSSAFVDPLELPDANARYQGFAKSLKSKGADCDISLAEAMPAKLPKATPS